MRFLKLTLTILGVLYALMSFGQVTYVVNTTDWVNDGVCDGVHCSLREAINKANSDGIKSIINFNISGTGPHAIYVLNDNPVLTSIEGDTINGLSQPNNDPMANQIVISDEQNNTSNLFSFRVSGNNWVIKGIDFLSVNPNKNIAFAFTGNNNLIKNSVIGGDIPRCINAGGSNNCIIENEIYGSTSDAVYLFGNNIFLSRNSFFCNSGEIIRIVGSGNTNKQSPIINYGDFNQVNGTSEPFDTIEVFKSDLENCVQLNCQGYEYLGTSIADNNGDWSIGGLSLSILDQVTATANIESKTSEFSTCYWLNDCPTSSLNSNITPSDMITLPNGKFALSVGSTEILEGNPVNGTEPYIYHEWNIVNNSGQANIINNNDGTANIQGFIEGSLVVEYLVLDSDNCAYRDYAEFEVINPLCYYNPITCSISGPCSYSLDETITLDGQPMGGTENYTSHTLDYYWRQRINYVN